jgi:hypothetical protein
VLKGRLIAEGNETVTNCERLKMMSPDGKMRLTDVADTEQILRLAQSIPNKKAEPFKQWLARVGSERIDETIDPEQSIDRAIFQKNVPDFANLFLLLHYDSSEQTGNRGLYVQTFYGSNPSQTMGRSC